MAALSSGPDLIVDNALGSSNSSQQKHSNLGKRNTQLTKMWPASQVSCPPGIDWNQDSRIRTANKVYSQFYYHESAGEGQYVYVLVSKAVEISSPPARRPCMC